MELFETMRAFALIMERSSFTAAARELNVPRATMTHAIKALEARLGVRLLNRTTRVVAPTSEGQSYYAFCVRLIADLEIAERSLREQRTTGPLRIDVPGELAPFLFPRLSEFVKAHPGVTLDVSDNHRQGLMFSGVDCIVRTGSLHDNTVLALPLPVLPEATAASPDYCQRYGLPTSIDDLQNGHAMVEYFPDDADASIPLRLQHARRVDHVRLPTAIKVRSLDAQINAGLAGLGIIQAPLHRLDAYFAAGRLIPILECFPPPPRPVSIFYAKTRLSAPLYAFIHWATNDFHGQDA